MVFKKLIWFAGIVLLILSLLLISGCNQPMLKGKKVLMVIAPEDFKDDEYYTPKEIFQKAGVEVKTTSSVSEAVSVAGKKQAVDFTLDSADTDYDAIVFVGGPGASVYFDDENALDLAKRFYDEKKIVAAICIAPSILANAKILIGKRATAFPSEELNLKENGALYTAESVSVDNNIVTGNGPKAAKEFASQIVKILGK